jgi:hypothetical protein
MKKILLSLFCLTIIYSTFGQSFSLQDTNGVAINAGSTILALGDPMDEVITVIIHIKNNAAEAKDVKVKKVINAGDTLPLTKNYFCFGVCYSPDTYESPFPQTIQPGQVNDQFYCDYNPQTVPGKSTIRYVFFDANDRNDSVSVKVEYNASPASIADDLAKLVKLSTAYPNPASSTVHVDYMLPVNVTKARIAITDMLGSKVKEISLENHSGKARITVTDLIDGIYFYSLVADDKLVLTRKFVVRH